MNMVKDLTSEFIWVRKKTHWNYAIVSYKDLSEFSFLYLSYNTPEVFDDIFTTFESTWMFASQKSNVLSSFQ
jgi:hypothetical protein